MAFGRIAGCDAVDIRWVPHEEGRKKCCSIFESESDGFDRYGYCLNLCTLCCKKAIITFHGCEFNDPEEPTPVDDIPPEKITPTDRGFGFTSSSYGVPLPIVFGADRLTGNVFWASSVKTHLINGGTEYYQTCDFAIGFCEGEIDGILRMWLGDRLILDRTVDTDEDGIPQPGQSGGIPGAIIDLTDKDSPLRNLNSSERTTRITVHIGSESQLPDPFIADYEGYENTPGYRGVAYILFENFIISENTIPNIFVELTSNTTVSFPRLYALDISPEEFFDRPSGDSLLVDPSYNLMHVSFEDSDSSATPANGKGWRTFDYNTFEYEDSHELDETYDAVHEYDLSRLLPHSGNILMHQKSGNAGIIRVYNPYTGIFFDEFGPGGGVSDHNLATGLSALSKASLSYPALGTVAMGMIDVFMGVGLVNSAIGFVEIDSRGQIEFVRNLGAVMTEQDARSAYFQHVGSVLETNAEFADGISAAGCWVYMIVQPDGGADETLKVARIRVSDENFNSLIQTCEYEEFATISVDLLRGEGILHEVSTLIVDPSDGCLVIFCTLNADESIVFKYNQFTDEIEWLTTAPGYDQTNGSEPGIITNSFYGWITDGDGAVYRLDMKLGEVEQLEDFITDQDLPVPTSFVQYWNGYESSITYTSNSTDKRVVKFFIDKLTRATVDLGDIVESLLARVGMLSTDMEISDVAELTLTGYTISKKQSLRTSFAELAQAFKYDVVESNGRIRYLARGGSAASTINHKWFGDVDESGWLSAKDENDISRIRKINLTYRDIERDYKDNVQAISLPKTDSYAFDSAAAIDVKVPIVLNASTAKSLAEILLYSKLVYDTTYEGELPARYLNLDPGDVITVQPDDTGDNDYQMRIRRTTVGADKTIKFEASREDPDIYNDVVNLFGETGRYIKEVFRPIPPRIDVQVMEMPYRSEAEGDDDDDAYYMYVTFLNLRPNARFDQDITVKLNATESVTIPAPTNFPTWGYVINPPVSGSSAYATDTVSQLRVKIVSTTGAGIASATHADLLASDQCNLCWIDGELLQFTTATDEGDGVWLFTGLHRAKLGTITGYGAAQIGSRFVLLAGADAVLDDGSVRLVKYSVGNPATIAQFFLKSPNPLQANTLHSFSAMNLQAWTVADFQADYSGDDVEISWQRRTRFNGELPDDGDETTPVNEIDESYVIYLYTDDAEFDSSDASTYLRRVDTTTNTYTYTDAQQVADGFDRTTQGLFIAVYQQGSAVGYRTGATRKRYVPHV